MHKNGNVKSGNVVVIRYCGPKRVTKMSEILKSISAITRAGLGKSVALITDDNISGSSHGFTVAHITPETFTGKGIAVVNNGKLLQFMRQTIPLLYKYRMTNLQPENQNAFNQHLKLIKEYC